MNYEWRSHVLKELGWLKLSFVNHHDKFSIDGFYIPPYSGNTRLKLHCVGLDLANEKHWKEDGVAFGLYKADVWRVSATGIPTQQNNLISVSAHYESGHKATNWFHDWYWINNSSSPLPPLALMQYIGADDFDWFHFGGSTWAEKSLRAWEYYAKRSRSSIQHIVDWGCGCARVSRHYFDLCDAKITGLDIDSTVINWCKENLPSGEWHVTSPAPPTNLPDQCADLIVGHSVFTHLGEDEQLLWLQELQRVVKKDGLVMVTVLGMYAPFLEPISPSEEKRLLEYGFIEPSARKETTTKHVALTKTDADYPSYHKGVYHTHEYIQKTWSTYFDIVAILEGFADHQALVVMQKKS